jgi:hypothetical protein
MRRLLRLLPALAAGWLVSAPSQVAIEVAVSSVFVVPLLAISVYESRPAADAAPLRVAPESLPVRGVLPPLPCRPYWNDAHPPHRPAGFAAQRTRRCGDLASYI